MTCGISKQFKRNKIYLEGVKTCFYTYVMFHTEKPATQIAHLVFADTQADLKKTKRATFPERTKK